MSRDTQLWHVRSALTSDVFGYPKENIVLLSDDTKDPELKPTKANIIKHIGWLTKDAKRDDSLFFH